MNDKMEDIDKIFNQVVLLLIKENLIGTCLLGSILLLEALKKRGIDSKLQEGFLIINNMYYSYHVWLIVNNKNYDVSIKVSKSLHESMSKMTYKLSIDEPKDIERIDLNNHLEIYEYLRMKKAYSDYLITP